MIKIFKLGLVVFFVGLVFFAQAQRSSITINGTIIDETTEEPLPFANVLLKTDKDSSLVKGVITDEMGLFTLSDIKPGNYFIEASYLGYKNYRQPLYVGSLTPFIDVKKIKLVADQATIQEVTVEAKKDNYSVQLDKKTYNIEENVSQSGGSALQAMQNLPGITIQEGKVQLRGNDKVMVLINGNQTAITGFGSQAGLENIPASSIEKIEIINNPSAKYDANGNGGIINIILKKGSEDGLHGKAGLSAGLGALWIRKQNLPGIRPQYHLTPKVNPSLSFNSTSY